MTEPVDDDAPEFTDDVTKKALPGGEALNPEILAAFKGGRLNMEQIRPKGEPISVGPPNPLGMTKFIETFLEGVKPSCQGERDK